MGQSRKDRTASGKSRTRYKGLRTVKDRQGQPRYHYVTPLDGGPEVRIGGEPGTPDFERAYHAARGGAEPIVPRLSRRTSSFGEMTMQEAIELYQRSPTWHGYAGETRYKRSFHLKTFLKMCPEAPLGKLTQAKLLDMLSKLSARSHREHAITIRMIFQHINALAVSAGEARLLDPTFEYPWPNRPPSRGFRQWKEAEVTAFRSHWPLGSIQRTIFELAIETLQRGSDLRQMKWSDIMDVIVDDEHGNRIVRRMIYVPVQEKTKQPAYCPITPMLDEALAAWRAYIDRRHEEIHRNRTKWTSEGSKMWRNNLLLSKRADAYREQCKDYILRSPNWLYRVNKQRFKEIMREAIRALGLPTYRPGDTNFEDAFSPHGLRKAGMAAMAEAGAGVFDIQAVSGHVNTKSVAWYVKEREKIQSALRATSMREAMEARQAKAKASGTGEVVPLKKNRY